MKKEKLAKYLLYVQSMLEQYGQTPPCPYCKFWHTDINRNDFCRLDGISKPVDGRGCLFFLEKEK